MLNIMQALLWLFVASRVIYFMCEKELVKETGSDYVRFCYCFTSEEPLIWFAAVTQKGGNNLTRRVKVKASFRFQSVIQLVAGPHGVSVLPNAHLSS